MREYYLARYEGNSFGHMPWGEAQFDCVISFSADDSGGRLASSLAVEIINYNVDYVQVAGPTAETLHDLIDLASVRAGRQASVGDGSPMTTWHEDAADLQQMMRVAYDCLGESDIVLCVVIGTEFDEQRFASLLKGALQETQ